MSWWDIKGENPDFSHPLDTCVNHHGCLGGQWKPRPEICSSARVLILQIKGKALYIWCKPPPSPQYSEVAEALQAVSRTPVLLLSAPDFLFLFICMGWDSRHDLEIQFRHPNIFVCTDDLSVCCPTDGAGTACGAQRAVLLTEWALLAVWLVISLMFYLKMDLTRHPYWFTLTLNFQPLSALIPQQKKVAKLELRIITPVPMDVK